jgi:hypothetical protein
MIPTPEEAKDAQSRLGKMAETIDQNYHLVQLTPQVAEDIRIMIGRLEFLESLRMSALKFVSDRSYTPPSTDDMLHHTPGQPTLGLLTVADYARQKRAEARSAMYEEGGR